MHKVWSGICVKCRRGALLYPARKAGELVGICYECRELVKKIRSNNV